MILERFNAVTFIGDNIAQTIYTAFSILLRQDLSLGGLQLWTMDDQDRINCKCDNQFLNTDCLGYTIKSVEEVKKNQGDERVPISVNVSLQYLSLFQTSNLC
jgi:hypothetical protein